jgi:hypothetical protein
MFLLVLLVVVLAFIIWISNERKKRDAALHEAFLARLRTAYEYVGNHPNIPAIEPDGMALQRGEECYWLGDCEWFELRSRTKRVGFHGPVASLKIAKGLHYRVGSIQPIVERTTDLVKIDTGRIYLTSKRVFFDGREKNSTLTWKTVASISPFLGGFEIEKQTGRSPHIHLTHEPEIAAAIATRAHEERS